MADHHSQPLPQPLSYLTLGDGDFSYSLDLCRFLATHPTATTGNAATPDDADQIAAAPAAVQITCTGIDTHRELQSKYRNVKNILNKIASLDEKRVAKRLNRKRKRSGKKKKQKNTCRSGGDDNDGDDDAKKAQSGLVPLSIRIDHGVNAIIMPNSTVAPTSATSGDNSNNVQRNRHHHVIFNHPHLGTESAARHRRFLSHLFHSVRHHWLARDGGVFHLTLVLGQADRWDCLDAASRNGFQLLYRGEFKPPPPPPPPPLPHAVNGEQQQQQQQLTNGGLGRETHYKSRRHQSGRSFATRSEGSETLTFGRVCDEGRYVAPHLPWQELPRSHWVVVDGSAGGMLQCPHCTKSFRDERARKNHVKCAHPDGGPCTSTQGMGDATRNLAEENTTSFICAYCPAGGNDNGRMFSTAQGLADHIRAKHSAIHNEIKPEWARATSVGKEEMGGGNDDRKDDADFPKDCPECIGSCDICCLKYYAEDEEAGHMIEFVPPPVVDGDGKSEIANAFRCPHCGKTFKDARAVKQHENFCSKRLTGEANEA